MRYFFECEKCRKVYGMEMSLATYEKHKGQPPCRHNKKHKTKQVLTPIPFRVR